MKIYGFSFVTRNLCKNFVSFNSLKTLVYSKFRIINQFFVIKISQA